MRQSSQTILPILLAFFLLTFLISLLPESTVEAKDPSPDELMNMMGPMMKQMMTGMLETYFDIISNPDSAEKMAKFTRNYYDALIKQGFSTDQALQIVMAIGMPSIPSSQ